MSVKLTDKQMEKILRILRTFPERATRIAAPIALFS